MSLPPHGLACPDPPGCPILPEADLPPGLPRSELPAGTPLFRAYDGAWGFDEPNPGHGDARFSPFDDLRGARVPTIYLARDRAAALLETVFHDVHQDADRLIYEGDLRTTLLVHVQVPAPLVLADLRDPVLDEHGIGRGQVVSSPSEHYPCTRRLARRIHGHTGVSSVDGVLWHSRQAELTHQEPSEVMVVFADRYAHGRGGWHRAGPGSQNLLEGPGRLLVDEIATDLDATIVA